LPISPPPAPIPSGLSPPLVPSIPGCSYHKFSTNDERRTTNDEGSPVDGPFRRSSFVVGHWSLVVRRPRLCCAAIGTGIEARRAQQEVDVMRSDRTRRAFLAFVAGGMVAALAGVATGDEGAAGA